MKKKERERFIFYAVASKVKEEESVQRNAALRFLFPPPLPSAAVPLGMLKLPVRRGAGFPVQRSFVVSHIYIGSMVHKYMYIITD